MLGWFYFGVFDLRLDFVAVVLGDTEMGLCEYIGQSVCRFRYYVITFMYRERDSVEEIVGMFEQLMESKSVRLFGYAAMRQALPLRGIRMMVQAGRDVGFGELKLHTGGGSEIGVARQPTCSAFLRAAVFFGEKLEARQSVPLVRQFDGCSSFWVQALWKGV